MANDHWPLFDLEVRTPLLTLRYLNDELAAELVEVAAAGVHDPSTMPFSVPWTDLPRPEMEREAMRFYWSSRADTRPESWRLLHAVLLDDEVIGAGDLFATDFRELRRFETGSWLGRAFQGRGFGKELRMAALTLGFDGLFGDVAETIAWADNHASIGVTRALGYTQCGSSRQLRRGVADDQLSFRMLRARWSEIRRDDITLFGIEAARDFLRVRPGAGPSE